MRSLISRGVTEEPPRSEDWTGLRLTDWLSLPINIRLQNRLGELLLLIESLRSELQTEEAMTYLWIDELMKKLVNDIDEAMRGLTS